MRRAPFLFFALSVCIVSVFIVSCEFSSSSDNAFNTSASDGSNISGFYSGLLSRDRAVDFQPANIKSLTILQSGNSIEVKDSNGSVYEGVVGNRLSSVNNTNSEGGDDGSAGADGGTSFTVFQVGFSGLNRVTNREVEFSGTITIVVESVVVGAVFDEATGQITDTVTEDTLVMTLEGTWVEPGSGTFRVLARVNPLTETTTTTAPTATPVPPVTP